MIFCIYLPPIFAKSKIIVSNMIELIKHFIPKKYSFYILLYPIYIIRDFNLPHLDWTIPSSTFVNATFSKILFKKLFQTIN